MLRAAASIVTAAPVLMGKILRRPPPRPARSQDIVKDRAPALFWVINGINMTGMPSFALLAPDPEIWQIVAFLKKLPEISRPTANPGPHLR
jgi:hypothetical protein